MRLHSYKQALVSEADETLSVAKGRECGTLRYS